MTSSKIKSIFKRAVAAVISLSMLISLCVLPASAEEDYAWMLNFDGTDPAAGNPEGWVDPASTIFDSMDSEHGNVMKIPSTAGDVKACGNVFARNTWESGDTLEARDYVFSFDFYAKQTNVGYMLQVHGSDGNYMTFDIDNDGTASFAKGGGWVVPTVADEGFHKKFTYSINTWHTVAAVVTIADKKIDYYIDGEYLGTDIGNPAFGTGAFKFAGTFTDGGWVTKSADPDNQAVYFDNFMVKYTENGIAAEIEKATADGNISAIAAAINSGYQSIGISSAMLEQADVIRAATLLLGKINEENIVLKIMKNEELSQIISKMLVISSAEKGKITNIFDYRAELDLEKDKNWEWYSKDYVTTTICEDITKRLAGEYVSETEFNNKIEEAYVLSIVKNADNINVLREVFEHFYNSIGIGQSAQDNTYAALMGQDFNSYEELRAEFNRLENQSFSYDFSTIDNAVTNKNLSDLINILNADYKEIGIDEDLFILANAEKAAILLMNKLSQENILFGNLSVIEAVKITKRSFVISAISEGNINNIFDYRAELDLEKDKNWEWYSKDYVTTTICEDITKRLEGEYASEKEFYNRIEEAYVLSIVKHSDAAANVKDVLTYFYKEIGISQNGKEETYAGLIGQNFNSYGELKNVFNKLNNQTSSVIENAWHLDFESGKMGTPEGMVDPESVIYDTGEPEHGHVMKIPSVTGDVTSLANVFGKNDWSALLEAKDYVLSFDFCARQTNVGYVMQITGNEGSYACFVIDNDGTVSFSKGGIWVEPVYDDTVFHKKVQYEKDKWYSVDVVVSTENRTVDYYIDGKYLGTDTDGVTFGNGAFKFAGFATAGSFILGEANPENQAVYFDNFNITYKDKNVFSADTKVEGNNVTVSFSEMPTTQIKTVEMFSCEDGTKINVSDEVHNGKTLSFTANGMKQNVQYAVLLPSEFKSVSGSTFNDKFIYFYLDDSMETYVKAVKFTDKDSVTYGPLEEIPVIQTQLDISFSEKITATADELLKAVSLKDSDGNECELLNPIIVNNTVTFDIGSILNVSKQYTLLVDIASQINYTALFKTQRGGQQGVFPIKAVSSSGNEIADITQAQGTDIYASTKFVNAENEPMTAFVVLAAYKDSNNILDMISCISKEIVIDPMKTVMVGADNSDVQIKMSVPSESDVIKAFLWQSETSQKPLTEKVSVPEITPVILEGESGIEQKEDGSVALICNMLNAETEASVSIQSDIGEIVYADQLTVDANKSLSAQFNMTNAISGDYTAFIIDSNGNTIEYNFSYINLHEYYEGGGIVSVIDKAVADKNLNAVIETLKSNYKKLGVSSNLFENTDTGKAASLLAESLERNRILLSGLTWQEASKIVNKMFIIASVSNGVYAAHSAPTARTFSTTLAVHSAPLNFS